MRAPIVAILVLVPVISSGCLAGDDSASEPGKPDRTQDPPTLESIMVAVRIGRNTYTHDHAFQIEIRSPDGVWRNGTVGSNPESGAAGTVGTGPTDNTTGDFRPRSEEDASTYPYTVFEEVEFNGTWFIQIERLYARELTQEESNCAHFIFSYPGGTTRVFSESVYAVPDDFEGFSFADIEYEYGGNSTITRHPEDDCLS